MITFTIIFYPKGTHSSGSIAYQRIVNTHVTVAEEIIAFTGAKEKEKNEGNGFN